MAKQEYQELIANPEFRELWADHSVTQANLADIFINDYPYDTANLIETACAQLDTEMKLFFLKNNY